MVPVTYAEKVAEVVFDVLRPQQRIHDVPAINLNTIAGMQTATILTRLHGMSLSQALNVMVPLMTKGA